MEGVREKKRGGEDGREYARGRKEMHRVRSGKRGRGRGLSPRRVAAFASARGQRSSTFAPECPW